MSLHLRPARPTDAGATGEILSGFAHETPWMPVLHSGAETLSFCGTMIDRDWVTLAVEGRDVVGFLARDRQEIVALYVRACGRGQGVGRMLLDGAKAQVARLLLWTFAANTGARRFYEREGFRETARGDGAGNDEGLPDIHYTWHREARR